MNREPKTTSAWSSTIGWMSSGYCSGSYSRSASWTMTISPVACRKPGAQGGPFALVDLVVDDLQIDVARLFHLAEDLARAVSRAVVDHDDLLPDRNGSHPPEDLVDRGLLVIDRNDDGKRQVVGDPEQTQLAASCLTEYLQQLFSTHLAVAELACAGAVVFTVFGRVRSRWR